MRKADKKRIGMFSSFKQGKRKKAGRSTAWRNLLVRRWKQNPNCRFCGKPTVISHEMIQPDNGATLDHLYSNLDLRRLIPGASEKVVLACSKCNNKRSAAECRIVYANVYDKRNNNVDVIEMLKTGEIPQAKRLKLLTP